MKLSATIVVVTLLSLREIVYSNEFPFNKNENVLINIVQTVHNHALENNGSIVISENCTRDLLEIYDGLKNEALWAFKSKCLQNVFVPLLLCEWLNI